VRAAKPSWVLKYEAGAAAKSYLVTKTVLRLSARQRTPQTAKRVTTFLPAAYKPGARL